MDHNSPPARMGFSKGNVLIRLIVKEAIQGSWNQSFQGGGLRLLIRCGWIATMQPKNKRRSFDSARDDSVVIMQTFHAGSI